MLLLSLWLAHRDVFATQLVHGVGADGDAKAQRRQVEILIPALLAHVPRGQRDRLAPDLPCHTVFAGVEVAGKPDAQVADEAYATARRICAGAPLVAGWHKQWIRRLQSGRPLNDEEKAASFAFLDTEDYREGLAAFLEKRKPAFKAR